MPKATKTNNRVKDSIFEIPGVFKVKAIKAVREKRYKYHTVKQYLVQWDGYDDDQNTWEPEENIYDKQLIHNFEKNRKCVKASWQFLCPEKKKWFPYPENMSSAMESVFDEWSKDPVAEKQEFVVTHTIDFENMMQNGLCVKRGYI